MLVGAARTREPRPSAPVMTARAAVGLRFRPVRFGVHSHLVHRRPIRIAMPTPFHRCARKDELDRDASRERCSPQS